MESKQIQINEDVLIFNKEIFFGSDENIYIYISTEYPDFTETIHTHKFIEFVYVISGQATHVLDNHKSSASKGNLFIINYDTPHAFYVDKNAKEAFITYNLMFTPDFFDSSMMNANIFESLDSSFLLYSLFPEKQEFDVNLQFPCSNCNIFGDLFNKIYLEYNNREKGYINIIRAYMVELIIKMFREMNSFSYKTIPFKQKQIVNAGLEYLHKNFNKRVTMEELATKIFLSKDYYGRLFKAVTGMPVSVLLRQIRIEEACKLLTTTDWKITDIAEYCGFNDIKLFYNAFKKANVLTPGEYRNKSIKVSLNK